MAIAGHVSPRMLARYSHVRSAARRQAVMALSAKPMGSKVKDSRRVGYDTNYDTKETALEIPGTEVIERYGRHEETRTPDLYRVKVAL